MCVCMDGPARVSVMYLYMILHTYINLDIIADLARNIRKSCVFFFAANAMTHKGLSRSLILAKLTLHTRNRGDKNYY